MSKDTNKEIKFCSSFGPDGYELYGKSFLETWVKHWPHEIHIYYETEQEPEIKHEKIIYHKMLDVPGCLDFLQRTTAFPIMQGVLNGVRNYKYDVFRYARKSFVQLDVASDYDGLLFWIDADVVTHSPPPSGWLQDALKDTFMCYLGRPEWHSCTSFVGWDCSHERSKEFWDAYRDIYVSGKFLALPEWHDCYMVDFLRLNLKLPAKNLAEGMDLKGPANVFNDVLTWAEHMKGIEKFGPQRYGQILDVIKHYQPKKILEVGTWNGDRAIKMVEAAGGKAFYFGFDLFEEANGETDEYEKNVKKHYDVSEIEMVLDAHKVQHRLVKGNTNETLSDFAENYKTPDIDFAYIDGGHAVETIRSDWENVKKLMKPGGIVIFDDYYEGMSEHDLDKWGANRILEEIGDFELLPVADPVKGGGKTLLAMISV